MSTRSFVPFVLAFAANVVWQGLLLIIDPIPRGRADIYGEAAAMWALPSIGNLVFLYRKRVFARLKRVGRVAALCAVSAVATHFALIIALALGVMVEFTLHGVPKPNKSMEPTGASGSGQLQSLRQWPLAPAAHAHRWEILE